jgi:hypothetical protein
MTAPPTRDHPPRSWGLWLEVWRIRPVDLASDRPPDAVLACLRAGLARSERRRAGRAPGLMLVPGRRTGHVVRGHADRDGRLRVRAIHPSRSSAWTRALSARVAAGPDGGTVVRGGFAVPAAIRVLTALQSSVALAVSGLLWIGFESPWGLAAGVGIVAADVVLLGASIRLSLDLEDHVVRWLEDCLRQ